MAYYPDLTPYEYAGVEPQPKVLNIGWLSNQYSFPKKAPSSRLVSALELLVTKPVNLFRGEHFCEFCPSPLKKISAGGIPMLDPIPGTTGNGEIGVNYTDGVTYVAPLLILRYVTEHHYAPPQQFVDAVLQMA